MLLPKTKRSSFVDSIFFISCKQKLAALNGFMHCNIECLHLVPNTQEKCQTSFELNEWTEHKNIAFEYKIRLIWRHIQEKQSLRKSMRQTFFGLPGGPNL